MHKWHVKSRWRCGTNTFSNILHQEWGLIKVSWFSNYIWRTFSEDMWATMFIDNSLIALAILKMTFGQSMEKLYISSYYTHASCKNFISNMRFAHILNLRYCKNLNINLCYIHSRWISALENMNSIDCQAFE